MTSPVQPVCDDETWIEVTPRWQERECTEEELAAGRAVVSSALREVGMVGLADDIDEGIDWTREALEDDEQRAVYRACVLASMSLDVRRMPCWACALLDHEDECPGVTPSEGLRFALHEEVQ